MGERPWRQLQRLEGRWPDYALAVAEAAQARGVPLPEAPLGPCTAEEFTAAVQEFLEQLEREAEAAEALSRARGKWPDYPRAVMRLSRERGQKVPGTYLPGPPEFWERMRAAPPGAAGRRERPSAPAEPVP